MVKFCEGRSFARIKSMKDNKKNEYSNKILNILAEKSAVAEEEIKDKIHLSPISLLTKERDEEVRFNNIKKKYAFSRAIKNLAENGFIEILKSDNKKYLKLTKKGKNKLNYLKLEGSGALVSKTWDGMWRIIILDIPENRKGEREALRYLLKKANFVCVKNTVWVSPLPYENLFMNIKKDMRLGNELMIIITDKFYK